MSWHSALTNALAENSLLQRLCFATLELVVLSLVLALIVRCARFSSQRLVACLWLIVLAKPLVTLAVGTPIVLFELEVPVLEMSQVVHAPSATAPATDTDESSEQGSATAFIPVGRLTRVASEVDSPAPATASSATGAGPLRIETLLLAIWAAGVAYCAVRYVRVRWQLSRIVRRAVPAPEPLRRMYAAITREVGLARIPNLRVIDDLDSPALVGLVHPTVLLPRRLVEHDSRASTEWALRHELAHWRRLDPLAILVRDCVSVCFFFHPLLPWAVRRHAEAMEMACDWESLRDPSDAAEYAEGLCGILVLMRNRLPERAIESSLAMATHGRMVRRIRALLDGERARPLTPKSAVGVLLVAVAVFAIGCTVGHDAEATVPRKAVLDGLCWLARLQNPDGSWSGATIATLCPCDDPMYKPAQAYTRRYDEGVTGLVLLSFFGAGFSDDSSQELIDAPAGKRYRTGDVVAKGLSWLTKRQKPDGSFCADRAYMYSEALAGMAVAEAYGLTRNLELKEPAQRAMNFIMGAQRPGPSGGEWGWRYASRQEVEQFRRGGAIDESIKKELYDADSSVTTWCTMALRSGAKAGLDIDQQHFDGALAFTKWVTASNGMVGYLSAKGAGATVSGPGDHYNYHPAVMSALGMCTRSFVGHDVDDAFRDLAAKQVVKDMPTINQDRLSIDYYYWYFGTLALSQFDGPGAATRTDHYWGPWKKAVIDSLLALQDHEQNPCTNGGWMVPDRWSTGVGPIYTTALNVLTLEAYDQNGVPAAGAARK